MEVVKLGFQEYCLKLIKKHLLSLHLLIIFCHFFLMVSLAFFFIYLSIFQLFFLKLELSLLLILQITLKRHLKVLFVFDDPLKSFFIFIAKHLSLSHIFVAQILTDRAAYLLS